MRSALIAITVVATAAVGVVAGMQESNPRFGRWKLKSEAPAPQSNIMTYAPAPGGGMRVTIDAVNARGDASQWGYTTMFDGNEQPVFGREGQTAAVRMITDRVAEIVYRQNGRISQVLTNVLSPDGNTIGIIYMRPGADGRPDSVSFATYERIR